MTDYQKLPLQSVQAVYDRIALLEWFKRQDEATDADVGELVRLKELMEVK